MESACSQSRGDLCSQSELRMTTLPKAFAIVAFILCLFMPSAQSLWIDEAQTWHYASAPTVGALFSELNTTHTSEGLMPLGMLVPWAGIRIFGEGEWQLRALNILWAAVAVGAFLVLGRRWRVPWAPLFMAVQPFLWYYADEARPYALQIAASAWLLVGRALRPVHALTTPSHCGSIIDQEMPKAGV